MLRQTLLFAATLLLCHLPLSALANQDDCLKMPVTGEGTNYLHGLELCNREGSPAADETEVASANNGKVIVNLGLGETLNKTITLQPLDDTLEFKVEKSFETSLTIMDEGPHMDLLNWRHYVSDWEALPQANATTFLSHEVINNTFLTVSTEEIVAAVAEESAKWAKDGYGPGERWVTVAKGCKAADSYPCGVSVSKVFLRIMVKVAGQWEQIQMIEVKIPMGC